MKKIFTLFLWVVFSCVAFAEGYQIVDVQYDLDGRTKEYALNKNLDIRRDIVFDSEEEFKLYIDFVTQKVSDQRILENTNVSYQMGAANEQGVIPVTLLISADETWNILPVPS